MRRSLKRRALADDLAVVGVSRRAVLIMAGLVLGGVALLRRRGR